jgi:hypothetical protein
MAARDQGSGKLEESGSLRACLQMTEGFCNIFPYLYNRGPGKDYSFVVISMKRVIASILAVLYLSTSMGATVHFHYCMGRLVSWGLADGESKYCASCGMAKKAVIDGCSVGMKDCCHDEHKHFQSDRAQKPAQSWVEWNLTPALTVLPHIGWNELVVVTPSLAHPVANGPPLAGKANVFLRNCNLRI